MKGLSRIIAVLAAMAGAVHAEDPAAIAIRQKLESEFKLTKPTADNTEIVTAGSVIVLHEDGIVMVAASSSVNCMNTYRDGKISAGACGASNKVSTAKDTISRLCWRCPKPPGPDKILDTHTFVDGEKFWMTKIEVQGKDRRVVFDFFTDAIGGDPGTRYMGQLAIPFGAHMPSPDDALKLVQTVITVDASAEAKADTKQEPAPSKEAVNETAPSPPAPSQPEPEPAAAPAPAPVAPKLESPPPPTENIDLQGKTKAQVEAAMGQPVKQFTAGDKVIYVYKDLKITFINGKVSNVE